MLIASGPMGILSGRSLALALAGVATAAVTSIGVAAASSQGTTTPPCPGQVSTPGGAAGPAQRADPDDVGTEQGEDNTCEMDGSRSDDGTREAPDTDQGEGNEGSDS